MVFRKELEVERGHEIMKSNFFVSIGMPIKDTKDTKDRVLRHSHTAVESEMLSTYN